MKEHQVKINQSELSRLAANAAMDLFNAIAADPYGPNSETIETNLERVNYLVKRYAKAISGKPEIETQSENETNANAAPVAQSPAGWSTN